MAPDVQNRATAVGFPAPHPGGRAPIALLLLPALLAIATHAQPLAGRTRIGQTEPRSTDWPV